MNDGDEVSTMDWVVRTQFVNNRRLSHVWPVFLEMRRWYTKYAFEVVTGPDFTPGQGLQEGQVLRLTSATGLLWATDAAASGPQHLMAKVIKVDAPKEIVVFLSGQAFDWKRYALFYALKLTESAAGTTTIVVDAYGHAELTASLTRSEYSNYHQQFIRSWQDSWSAAFTELEHCLNADSIFPL